MLKKNHKTFYRMYMMLEIYHKCKPLITKMESKTNSSKKENMYFTNKPKKISS